MNFVFKKSSLYLLVVLFIIFPTSIIAKKNIDDVAITLTPPGDPDYFAENSTAVGDINNDGFMDVALSSSLYSSKERGVIYLLYGQKEKLTSSEIEAVKITGRKHEEIEVITNDGGCDINGDNYNDIIVTTGNYNIDEREYVRHDQVYIIYGQANKITANKITKYPAFALGDNLGLDSIACDGDINADGYDDILLGESAYSSSDVLKLGRVFIIYGHDGVITTDDFNEAIVWYGQEISDNLGSNFGQVDYIGDVNNDGFADFLISETGNSEKVEEGGMVYLIYGQTAPLTEANLNQAVVWYSTVENASIGSIVSTAGDLNHDNYDDFIISDRDYDTSEVHNVGALYLFYGQAAKLSGGDITQADSKIIGVESNDYIGNDRSVTIGKINNDKYSDIIFSNFKGADSANGGEINIQYGQKNTIKDNITSNLLKYYRINYLEDTTNKIEDISVADLNGNGLDDIIIVNTVAKNVQIIYK